VDKQPPDLRSSRVASFDDAVPMPAALEVGRGVLMPARHDACGERPSATGRPILQRFSFLRDVGGDAHPLEHRSESQKSSSAAVRDRDRARAHTAEGCPNLLPDHRSMGWDRRSKS
jgi:hypothetical protein